MFYVSNITGNLVPFEPSVTPISSTVTPVAPAPPVLAVSQVTATQSPEQLVPRVDTSIEPQDAAVFEGDVILNTRQLTGMTDSLNVGRAGALMAYRVQEANFTPDFAPVDDILPVKPAENIKNVEDPYGESAERVDPIRRERYKRKLDSNQENVDVLAEDIMSSPVFTLYVHEPLEKAESVFREHKFRHIPILSSEGLLVGILSDRDFIRVSTNTPTPDEVIRTRMVTNILTAKPHTLVREIAKVLIEHRVGCIPILGSGNLLVGMITRSDILRAVVEGAPIH